MSKLTETIAIRLTLDEVRAIENISKDRNVKKSETLRQIIKTGLKQDDLNQKLLVESLMILRSSIDEQKYKNILVTMDEFKKLHGLDK